MENSNNKFHNKPLRNAEWKLEKALTPIAYTKRVDELAKLNQKAVEWTEAVDKKKWAAAYSPCARFGTMTSNNIESVISTLMAARQESLLDCLMTIEKYVSGKWVEITGKMTKWGQLSEYAEKRLLANSSPAVKRDGQLSTEYAIDQDKASGPCSCWYFQYMDARSVHVVASLKHINNLSILREFIGKPWTTAVCKQAYDPLLKTPPTLTKDELLRFEHHQPPPVSQKRGPPKKSKKRIESQPPSLALKSLINKYILIGQIAYFGVVIRLYSDWANTTSGVEIVKSGSGNNNSPSFLSMMKQHLSRISKSKFHKPFNVSF
uniref:AlNc14C279G10084 protein n=1 Tax=Albugo laibachii Nc14 TaxID=890382 RepID=F0WUT6_9STRA|nr:AlNc14C279G10084 [Albugo laibachii Nc14]|eukprot:CCA25172.1 AlNc14C279G10084 [Albugo laibachii Nc14]